MRSAGDFGDVVHHPGGQHHRVRTRLQRADDLLDGYHGPPRGQHRLFLHSGDPPELHVAGPVGALRVDDGHIRPQRGHRGERLAGERADDRAYRAHRGQPGAVVAAQHGEREPGRAGHVPVRHPRVAVLLELQRDRPPVLHRVAEPVQRPDTRVAAPGEDQLARAARADELVVDQVGCHPDQRQVAPLLADQLVAGGERYQVRETLHRHRVAVMHGAPHGLGERDDVRHKTP